MAVRSTMATLIARVRLLIGDPSGGSSQFADQDIQDVLDENRLFVRQAMLRSEVTFAPGGSFTYTDYFASLDMWEDDVLLQDGGWRTLTPLTTDNLTGHWTFASQIPPVYLTGKTFDVYMAAALLLERWAAAWARNYDFSADGNSFKRSQAAAGMLAQAAQYRKMARGQTIKMGRDDSGAADGPYTSIAGNPEMWY